MESEIKAFLEDRYNHYNQPSFIDSDPIRIPHSFSLKEDIEIAGFVTAIISWGRRDMILRSAENLMERMDRSPMEFVLNANAKELKQLNGFVYRTCNEKDIKGIVLGLRKVYLEYGGLEKTMALKRNATDPSAGIANLRNIILSAKGVEDRTSKHIADPLSGSSAKRLCMYLRWMVRNDQRGVDFGLWKSIRPDQLACPLDIHSGKSARALGLLHRNQNDWKSVIELTEELKKLDPNDPVKYDFSLFGLGVFEKFSI